MQNELYHYGVKGMKWGVRRVQKKYANKAQRQADSMNYAAKLAKVALDNNYIPVAGRLDLPGNAEYRDDLKKKSIIITLIMLRSGLKQETIL